LLCGKSEFTELPFYNGFFVREHEASPLYNKPERSAFSDPAFNALAQPMIDETALMPPEVEMVRKFFGSASRLPLSSGRGYQSLENALFNFNDAQRSYAFTNF